VEAADAWIGSSVGAPIEAEAATLLKVIMLKERDLTMIAPGANGQTRAKGRSVRAGL